MQARPAGSRRWLTRLNLPTGGHTVIVSSRALEALEAAYEIANPPMPPALDDDHDKPDPFDQPL